MLILTFPEVEKIGKRVAKELGVEYVPIEVGKFPDSELHLKIKKNPEHKNVVIINSMSGNPNDKIIETILAGGVARDYGAVKVTLVATYLPYMRQDTHFEKYDSFSSKHIIRLFNEFDRIIAIDPHLHRLKSMKDIWPRAESISVDKIVAEYIKKKFKDDFEIIGPDSESRQWSAVIAKILNKKVTILNKERFGDEKIKQKEVKLDSGVNYIIIDDIISTGRTLAGALAMAKKQGAKKLYCIGIHGILAGDAVKLITKHSKLITSNTIPSKFSDIDVSSAIVDALKK
jgi:ribose-phosphate pyrophosphokinase